MPNPLLLNELGLSNDQPEAFSPHSQDLSSYNLYKFTFSEIGISENSVSKFRKMIHSKRKSTSKFKISIMNPLFS